MAFKRVSISFAKWPSWGGAASNAVSDAAPNFEVLLRWRRIPKLVGEGLFCGVGLLALEASLRLRHGPTDVLFKSMANTETVKEP